VYHVFAFPEPDPQRYSRGDDWEELQRRVAAVQKDLKNSPTGTPNQPATGNGTKRIPTEMNQVSLDSAFYLITLLF